jgi:hypothetical protein
MCLLGARDPQDRRLDHAGRTDFGACCQSGREETGEHRPDGVPEAVVAISHGFEIGAHIAQTSGKRTHVTGELAITITRA